jgi:hypothetical protein
LSFSPQVSQPEPFIHLYSPPYVLLPRPPHSSRFDHLNNIGWGNRFLQTAKSPNRNWTVCSLAWDGNCDYHKEKFSVLKIGDNVVKYHGKVTVPVKGRR